MIFLFLNTSYGVPYTYRQAAAFYQACLQHYREQNPSTASLTRAADILARRWKVDERDAQRIVDVMSRWYAHRFLRRVRKS